MNTCERVQSGPASESTESSPACVEVLSFAMYFCRQVPETNHLGVVLGGVLVGVEDPSKTAHAQVVLEEHFGASKEQPTRTMNLDFKRKSTDRHFASVSFMLTPHSKMVVFSFPFSTKKKDSNLLNIFVFPRGTKANAEEFALRHAFLPFVTSPGILKELMGPPGSDRIERV